jgi:hypothetical protein
MQKNIRKYRHCYIYTKTLAHPKTLEPSKLADAKTIAHPKSLADAKKLAHGKILASTEMLVHRKN